MLAVFPASRFLPASLQPFLNLSAIHKSYFAGVTAAARYSRLRRNSKLMREPEAQPFWDSLEAIKRSYECQSVKVDSFRIYIFIYIFI